MRKTKLKLEELRLNSFITSTDRILGGGSIITITSTSVSSVSITVTTTKTGEQPK